MLDPSKLQDRPAFSLAYRAYISWYNSSATFKSPPCACGLRTATHIQGLAMRMRNMRFMRIMRICANMRMKISSTLSTYKYLPKMAIFWAKNGSAWLCFQFWVPKISLLFIPPGFIHPQEWKLRVQNHKILVKKRWFFFTIDAVYAHWCASDAHRCASAKIGAWPALIGTQLFMILGPKRDPWQPE